jgi:hypothetical protein
VRNFHHQEEARDEKRMSARLTVTSRCHHGRLIRSSYETVKLVETELPPQLTDIGHVPAGVI